MRLIDGTVLVEALAETKRIYLAKDIDSVALGIETAIAIAENAPTIDAVSVVHGEWEERETFHNADDNPIIEEWQSARCSVCNKYHTTPYMYYFSNYNYCPQCGAKMDEEREDK